MSNTQQQFKAGQAHGKGSATAERCIDTAKDKIDEVKHSDTAQQAQEMKEEAAGFLQQTGEQVKSMAQGAVESVKSTLGVGDSKRP